jgi:hypothetical protein
MLFDDVAPSASSQPSARLTEGERSVVALYPKRLLRRTLSCEVREVQITASPLSQSRLKLELEADVVARQLNIAPPSRPNKWSRLDKTKRSGLARK